MGFTYYKNGLIFVSRIAQMTMKKFMLEVFGAAPISSPRNHEP